MSYLDEDSEEPFSDTPEEVQGQYDSQGNWHAEQPPTPTVIVQPGQAVTVQQTVRTRPTVPLKASIPEEIEEELDEENEDFSEILNDANLRLEQGQLYKLIMNHNMFEGVEADAKALKNVQKEIRKFAKERMEVMLGMRQEVESNSTPFPMDQFPFNSLEIETLKALAEAATKGASREAAPFSATQPVKPQTLNPIIGGSNKTAPKFSKTPLPNKTANPLKRAKAEAIRARILAEEGVSEEELDAVFDAKKPLTREELARMTPEQIVERNKSVSVRTTKQVPSSTAVPMPSPEHIESIYTARAAQAAANPQMKMIMNALANQIPKKS